MVTASQEPRKPVIGVLELDADYPIRRWGPWLTAAGAALDTRRVHDGGPIPADTADWDGLICLGGPQHATDDIAWLPAVRELLATAVRSSTPTVAIGLGAQLLATATGGHVAPAPDGPEIGAYLGSRRDAADHDPLLVDVPITPDLMSCNDHIITALPAGATLLVSSLGYPHQAFRVGDAAWGTQFHPEAAADDIRRWAQRLDPEAHLRRRLGPALDEADEIIADVWPHIARRFVALAAEGVPATATGKIGGRLPLTAHHHHPHNH